VLLGRERRKPERYGITVAGVSSPLPGQPAPATTIGWGNMSWLVAPDALDESDP
jgi:hypothetical protein